MFFSARNTNTAGMRHELNIFSRLKSSYADDFAFGINGFPMFYDNGQSFREIDILFLHRAMGAFNIEVKGIQIHDIKQIIGHAWHMEEGFYDDVLAPFDQAMRQTYMLKDYLNKSLLLGKKMNISTIIALPEITKADWEARGFHTQLNIPTPIFKDDLANDVAFRDKLLSYTQDIKKRPLTDDDWNRLLALFHIEQAHTLSLAEDIPKYNVQLFSKVMIIESQEQWQQQLPEIELLLHDGVKIFLFTQQAGLRALCKQAFAPFMKEFLLEVFEPARSTTRIPFATFENGTIPDVLMQQLETIYPHFNSGQFKAIHCDVHTNEMITAGAGTGKTHVMIDRILYLITVARVKLREIIMITFTNASTNEMRKRLERRFITLFELTGNSSYLQFAEDVRTMQISTIHAYAKTVIQKLAHELGLGRAIELRSFAYEKKKIIETLVNQYFAEQRIEFFKVHSIKHYQFVNFAYAMWEEMEKKGLSKQEIESLDWGKPNLKSEYVGALLQYIFKHCEQELELLKQHLNAITMGDLIRKLKDFTGDASKLKQLNQNCFMFVDEFQDSDDVQISFIAELQKIANYKLFIVGDTKQSIYRFRGADYRSFDVLEKKMDPSKLLKLSLRHNYRSSKSLLKGMDKLFLAWGSKKPQLLSYDQAARLVSSRTADYSSNWRISIFKNAREKESFIKEHLLESMRAVEGTKKKIALLVRTNGHAKKIKEICNDLGIATTENLDGTFYKSLAVKHFKAILEALLYPNEPKFFITGMQTPYFRLLFQPQDFMKYNGNKDKLNDALQPFKETHLLKYIKQLRENSVMAVIQMIITDNAVLEHIQHYFEQLEFNEEQSQLEALRYIANLQHLMTLIERHFNQQNVSLHTLSSWITLMMNTNRSENEPVLENTQAHVTISTVHRAKGLEFDTVILPITDSPYDSVKAQFHLEDEAEAGEKRRIGWTLASAPNMKIVHYENEHFATLNKVEAVEQQKEEVRLLYVALTRAEQKVIVILPKDALQNTWAQLLKDVKIERVLV